MYGLPLDFFNKPQRELARESDRGQLLLAGIAIELFLKAKFLNEGIKPVSLFVMLKHARNANWIEADVFHDGDHSQIEESVCA